MDRVYILTIAAVALLTTLPKATVLAHPFTQVSPQTSDCAVHISTSTQHEMRGRYEKNDWTMSFSISLNQNTISSSTTFHNTSSGEGSTDIQTILSLPNTHERQIPGMTKMIIDAAVRVAQESDCNIPGDISAYYQEFADALYKCTMGMGANQFRFSVMYHSTIIASASRLCAGAETVCTPSPKYEFGTGLFICGEDLEQLFPSEALEGKQKMQSVQINAHHNTPNRERRYDDDCFWWGLEGGDVCCCGNYGGCCWYPNVLCCIHDTVCACCDQWHCGWACQPESGC